MNNKIVNKKSNSDAQDERINQLIARYSNVCQDVDKLKPKRKRTNDSIRNTFTSSTTGIGPKSRGVRAYPISNGRDCYKFRNSSNSGKEDGLHLLPGHDYNCSNHSNATYTDFSVSKTNENCPSEDARSTPNINFQDGCKHVNQQTSFTFQNVRKKFYTEKATYCPPVVDLYDRNFVSKVMERNAKLQKLLIKYVISRQTEKVKERHFMNSSSSAARKSENPLLTNEYWDTESGLLNSDSYRENLQDLYDTKDEEYLKYLAVYEKNKHNISLATTLCENKLKKHLLPYILETGKNENRKNFCRPHQYHETKIKSYDKNFMSRESYKTGQHFQPNHSNSLNQVYNCDIKQNRKAQTHITFGGYTENYLTNELHTTDATEIQDMTKDINEVENIATTKGNHDKIVYNPSIFSNITNPPVRNLELLTTDVETRAMTKDMNEVENIATIQENHDTVVKPVYNPSRIDDVTNPSIQNVEEKLDILIDLFHSLVSELKSKNVLGENKSNDVDENKQKIAIECLKSAISKTRMRIVCNVMTNTSFCALESNLTPSHYFLNMRLDKILREELEKSNIVRNEIADMLNKTYQSSGDVNIEIPTKECSTEVTASLSKTKLEYRREGTILKDISYCGIARSRLERRIAVNTEPLGLRTLLRLSSEAVKQILSFIPDIRWYLTWAIRPVRKFDYVCNICGAAFARPSQLNAHILCHDFDQPRECSVCRHAVNRRASQVFRCQHCGRMFARAYCCELHERECQAAHGSEKSLSRALLR